jgi:PhnB protein
MQGDENVARLNPYVNFPGTCKEAMTFYKDSLGGKLTIMTVGESQMAAQMPKEAHKNVLHSVLEKDGFVLMAADMMEPGAGVNEGPVSLCMVCQSKAEIESLFAKLSAGGKVSHPLKEEFFGTFGDFTDKFGINWMFQFDANAKP